MNELTQSQLRWRLWLSCTLRVVLGAQPNSSLQNERDFYVARLSSGLVKVGIARDVERRAKGLRAEATKKFPAFDLSTDSVSLVAVVRGHGRELEVGVLRELRCECIGGEWFRGPLSSAVANALSV